MSKQHALLAPSGAYRWLICGPSARLESKLPDVSSVYADEGTTAHALCEILLLYANAKISKKEFDAALKIIKEDQYYSVSMHDYCEDFKSYVMEKLNEYRVKYGWAFIFLEVELKLSTYIPESFGTSDVIIITEGIVEVIDLKYGQGVPVSCEENEQLMIYALGATERFTAFTDVLTVSMTIYQPRIGNISSWDTTHKKLMHWANTVLKPGAKKAFNGQGDYAPGDHCQFCKAKIRCAALKSYVMHSFKGEKIPGLITPQEVAEVLAKSPLIISWLNAINEYALVQARDKGVKWPGFKLVEGRSSRYFNDEKAVIKILDKYQYDDAEYMKIELHGITKITELLGGKRFKKLLDDSGLIGKSKGKPTLVPNSDKRPRMNDPEDVFKNVEWGD